MEFLYYTLYTLMCFFGGILAILPICHICGELFVSWMKASPEYRPDEGENVFAQFEDSSHSRYYGLRHRKRKCSLTGNDDCWCDDCEPVYEPDYY